MAELYNAHDVVVTPDAVSVKGSSTPISELARAEEYQVQDFMRNLVLFVVGCLGPIAAMIIYTQIGLIQDLRLWFGPVILLTCVGLGAAAAGIGYVWHRPWAVVVERKGIGFDPLFRCPGKDEASKAAAAINQAIGA